MCAVEAPSLLSTRWQKVITPPAVSIDICVAMRVSPNQTASRWHTLNTMKSWMPSSAGKPATYHASRSQRSHPRNVPTTSKRSNCASRKRKPCKRPRAVLLAAYVLNVWNVSSPAIVGPSAMTFSTRSKRSRSARLSWPRASKISIPLKLQNTAMGHIPT